MASVLVCTIAGASGAATIVWPGPISPESFAEAYVQQGRFKEARALTAELERAVELELEPAPAATGIKSAAGQAGAGFGVADSAVAAVTPRNDSGSDWLRRARSAVIRARIRLLLAEHDWANGRAIAERCRADEPLVCTFAEGYVAARLAWPGAKPELIDEAALCARRLEQAVNNPVSVAELYRVLVRAAIAAAQDESPELELLVAHAVSLETRLRETEQIDIPLQPASEIAGDLWLQLYRDETARQAYRASLDDWPHRPASLLGVARASASMHDDMAAKEAYRALLDLWPTADPTRPELAEARHALGLPDAPAPRP